MLTLYYKSTCPFSRQVLAVIDRLSLEVELKNLIDKEEYLVELSKQVGKSKTLCLIDTERSVSLFESDGIVCHLQTHYSVRACQSGSRRITVGEGVCIACEG